MEKTLYNRKGQITGVPAAIVTLIAGVGVAVLVLIFVGTLSGSTYQLIEPGIEALTGSTINDSFTANNVTAQALTFDDVVTGTLSVVNSTDDVIGLSNFTVNLDDGTMLLIGTHAQNGTTMFATYTYGDQVIEDHIKDSIISSFSALETTGDYLPIIVLAVVIALVLTLVLGFMSFGGGGGYGGSAL